MTEVYRFLHLWSLLTSTLRFMRKLRRLSADISRAAGTKRVVTSKGMKPTSFQMVLRLAL
jgi:hypothetical protein